MNQTPISSYVEPFIQVVEEGGKWFGTVVICTNTMTWGHAPTKEAVLELMVKELSERLFNVHKTLTAIKPVGL